jgi:thioredoxin 1
MRSRFHRTTTRIEEASMAGKTVETTDANFHTEVIKSETPVVVDFWAVWCGPCRLIAPIVEELATEYDGKVKFAKLDVDHNSATAMQYNVMSIPTLGVFKGGEMVDRIIGYMPKPELKRRIEAALGATVR